jgi:tRNA (cytosine38-C5)-methyltransferase
MWSCPEAEPNVGTRAHTCSCNQLEDLVQANRDGQIPPVQVLAAFDINPIANAVYAHNFGPGLVRNVRAVPLVNPASGRHASICSHCFTSVLQNNIESVPIEQLEVYGADMWMLAPPCQPYTRQGLRKGAEDARAQSFVALLKKCGPQGCSIHNPGSSQI